MYHTILMNSIIMTIQFTRLQLPSPSPFIQLLIVECSLLTAKSLPLLKYAATATAAAWMTEAWYVSWSGSETFIIRTISFKTRAYQWKIGCQSTVEDEGYVGMSWLFCLWTGLHTRLKGRRKHMSLGMSVCHFFGCLIWPSHFLTHHKHKSQVLYRNFTI